MTTGAGDGLFFPGKMRPNQGSNQVLDQGDKEKAFSSVQTFGSKNGGQRNGSKQTDQVKKSTERRSSDNLEDNYDDDFEEYDLETSVRKSLIQDPSPGAAKERFSAAQKNFGG